MSTIALRYLSASIGGLTTHDADLVVALDGAVATAFVVVANVTTEPDGAVATAFVVACVAVAEFVVVAGVAVAPDESPPPPPPHPDKNNARPIIPIRERLIGYPKLLTCQYYSRLGFTGQPAFQVVMIILFYHQTTVVDSRTS